MGLKTLISEIYTCRELGIRVPHIIITDDVNTFTSIYTITGTILLTLLLGIRTTDAGPNAADTMQYRHAGTANTVLDAGTLNIRLDLIGNMYNLNGAVADPIISCGVGLAALPIQGGVAGGLTATGTGFSALILTGGAIQVIHTNAAHTGASRYVLFYIPVTPNGAVAPV